MSTVMVAGRLSTVSGSYTSMIVISKVSVIGGYTPSVTVIDREWDFGPASKSRPAFAVMIPVMKS